MSVLSSHIVSILNGRGKNLHDKVLLSMRVCCRVRRNCMDCSIGITFVCEACRSPKFGILSNVFDKVVVKLALRCNVVPDQHGTRKLERAAGTGRTVLIRPRKSGNFRIRNIMHLLIDGTDPIEGLQKLFCIFGRPIVDEGP